MKFQYKYFFYLSFLAIMLIIVLSMFKQGENWTITFFRKDKNPFGAYILHDILDREGLFKGYAYSNNTIYELQEVDSINNLLILCERFDPGTEDLKAVNNLVNKGVDVMIMAHQFGRQVQDSFNLSTNNHDIKIAKESILSEDSMTLNFANPHYPGEKTYYYPSNMLSYYFDAVDTVKAAVIATNGQNEPVVYRQAGTKGQLIFGSVPLVFSNFGLLYRQNYQFAEGLLSYLNSENIYITNYYQFGRLESRSPLRFILSVVSWRMAVYLFLITAILFIIFESKRRQKPIPVLTPLRNQTLDFVKTIGNLYYQRGNHKDLAQKKWLYFQHYLKTHYAIDADILDGRHIEYLTAKLGKSEKDIHELIKWRDTIQAKQNISGNELNKFINHIEQFYK